MAAIKDRVFVELALRKNAIAKEQIRQAEATQQELERFGIHKAIWAVLVDKNLTPKDVSNGVAKEIEGYFIRCPKCGDRSALADCDHQGNLKCASCQAIVTYPEGRIGEDDLSASLATAAPRKSPAAEKGREAKQGTSTLAAVSRPKASSPQGRSAASEAPQAAKPRRQSAEESSQRKCTPSLVPEDLTPPSEITKFKLGRLVGVSTSGRLYRSLGSPEPSAIKVIDRALSSNKGPFKRWVELMQRVQDLPRSSTVKPIQLYREGAVNYLVRPFVDREDCCLRRRLAPDRPESRTADAVVALARGIFKSLVAFHSVHLVHGNLKPENVLVTDEGTQLSDPGSTLLLEGIPPEERLLRLWDHARYHAPEVLQGGEPTTTSDVYSAGKILEEALVRPDPARAGTGQDDSETLRWIQGLVKLMTAADPAERYPSAKEVLKDLEGTARPGRVESPARRRSFKEKFTVAKGRVILRKVARLQVLGPVLLAVTLAAMTLQTTHWFRARSALASPTRAEEVSDELIAQEIDALSLWTQSGNATRESAEARWSKLGELYQGTPWEGRILETSRRLAESLPAARDKQTAEAVARAKCEAAERRWVQAVEALLATEGETEKSREGLALWKEVLQGLYQDQRMLFVPGGEVEAGGGRKAVTAAPFLVDAGTVSRNKVGAGLKAPGDDAAVPLVGVDFKTAQEVARAQGKRVATEIQWRRMAALAADGEWREAFAAERLTNLRGPLYEWVDSSVSDGLARMGYGVCLGGCRDGVPITHPLRRKKSGGYPDVGVRLILELRASGPQPSR